MAEPSPPSAQRSRGLGRPASRQSSRLSKWRTSPVISAKGLVIRHAGTAARDAPHLRVTAAGVTRGITHGASVCAGIIRHGRARRAGAPFTRPSDVQTTPASKLRWRCTALAQMFARRFAHSSRGNNAGTWISAPHMVRASSSSLSTAVLHSVGARRVGGAGRDVRAASRVPARCDARARAQAA